MPTPDQIRILNALRRAADAYDADADHAETNRHNTRRPETAAKWEIRRDALRRDARAARQLADQLTDEYRRQETATPIAALAGLLDAAEDFLIAAGSPNTREGMNLKDAACSGRQTIAALAAAIDRQETPTPTDAEPRRSYRRRVPLI